MIVPRLSGSGSAKSLTPSGAAFWASTTIELPAGRWRDIFEDRMHVSHGSIAAGALLANFPFAVLRMTE